MLHVQRMCDDDESMKRGRGARAVTPQRVSHEWLMTDWLTQPKGSTMTPTTNFDFLYLCDYQSNLITTTQIWRINFLAVQGDEKAYVGVANECFCAVFVIFDVSAISHTRMNSLAFFHIKSHDIPSYDPPKLICGEGTHTKFCLKPNWSSWWAAHLVVKTKIRKQ